MQCDKGRDLVVLSWVRFCKEVNAQEYFVMEPLKDIGCMSLAGVSFCPCLRYTGLNQSIWRREISISKGEEFALPSRIIEAIHRFPPPGVFSGEVPYRDDRGFSVLSRSRLHVKYLPYYR
jgi:hypothetical protein